jgi:orotidine-5'-phosphate decarboxylase
MLSDESGKKLNHKGPREPSWENFRCLVSLLFKIKLILPAPDLPYFHRRMTRNPIIAALDVPTAEQALKLAEQIAPAVGAFKIGKELFVAAGPDIVRKVRATGASVFLDLKFHDIPNTVAKAVASAVRLDVQMLTIHTSGGGEMMRAAEKSAQDTAKSLGLRVPLVLGVTVLTSSNKETLAETGCEPDVEKQVSRLARLAVKSGLRGLVCSPLEIVALRKILPAQVQLVTPGIRTGAEKADDQKRTLTPREAIAAGANWLVIGRPIYAAENPRAAAEKILGALA